VAFAVKPPACSGCPAAEWSVGFVPPTGPHAAAVAFVGQGPGEAEAEFSVPFHPDAASGSRLSKWMHRSGWQRNDVLIGNVVQCWLPESKPGGRPRGNREPTRAEIASCWHRYVGPWLNSLPNLTNVVAVGVPAAKWLLQLPWDRGGERYAGTSTLVELPPLEAPK
jgi:uracil-DNA glycosylase family 4